MTQLVTATQEIRHNLDGEMNFDGHSEDGEPKLKSVPKIIRAGSVFDLSDWPESEQRWLWNLEAIREPTRAEIEIHKLVA